MNRPGFSLLKRERIKWRIYPTRDAARSDVCDYIEMFYDPNRRHGFKEFVGSGSNGTRDFQGA